MTRTAHTYCDLCLSACGLEVDIDDGRIVAVRGDAAHPLSAGYLCTKGKHGPANRQGPERLLHPLKRTETGWQQISWDVAYREVAARLREIRRRHGPQAIGMYYGAGNPTSFFNFLFAQGLMSALGSRSFFNVLSIEFTGRYLVQEKMYGHAFFATAGDFERSSFVLMFGHNPKISEEDPRKMEHIAEMRRRGAKLVVVDPRRTETARKADRWLPIVPGTDVYLALALHHVIIRDGLHDHGYITRRCRGFDSLARMVEPWSPSRVSPLTGIAEDEIENLAKEFASAPSACAVAKLGVFQTRQGTLAYWLVEALNAVTGNLERPGGLVFRRGALPLSLMLSIATRGRKRRTRDGLYPEIIGSLPAACIPDEILRPGPGQIRALLVDCGNPALGLPNEHRVQQALESLELLVSVDVFLNETAQMAHYVLPAAAHFEKEDCYVTFPEHQRRRFIQWAPALVPPRGEARPEWEIFMGLSQRCGVRLLNTPGLGLTERTLGLLDRALHRGGRWRFSPRLYAGLLLLLLARTRLAAVLRSAHGLLLPDSPRAGHHPNGRRVDLVPDEFAAALAKLDADKDPRTRQHPLLLITGERERYKANTRFWHLPLLKRVRARPMARLNRSDAERAGIRDGDDVIVSTSTGSIRIGARVGDDIMPGVVSIPHGWGRRFQEPSADAAELGVNVNRLTDDSLREPLTGVPVFNGIPCRLEKAPATAS
jgi:anaerobic selenocysteine-containing dehydrogenase